MTEPVASPGSPVERPVGGGLAAAVGPEMVGGIIAILVIVALLGSRFVVVGGGPGQTPSPTAAASNLPSPSIETVDRGAISTLRLVNGNLLNQGTILQNFIAAGPVRGQDIQPVLATINMQLISGLSASQQLAATPAGEPVAAKLLDVYNKLGGIFDSTTNILLSSPRWQPAAKEAVAQIQRLPALDAELDALLLPPSGPPSGSPGGSTPPSASVVPSPSVASPSVAPTATPTPAPISPSPSVAPSASVLPPPTATPAPGPNQLVNPGFEAGVDFNPPTQPWALVLTDPALATITADKDQPHGPLISARIDIQEPTTSPQRIALQQAGLAIEPGANYQIQLYARSSAPRSIRVRVLNEAGQFIGTGAHTFSLTTDWAPLTFEMTSFGGSANATFTIDLGGSTETVWVDDVSLERIPPGAP